jgi:hypothetical protein
MPYLSSVNVDKAAYSRARHSCIFRSWVYLSAKVRTRILVFRQSTTQRSETTSPTAPTARARPAELPTRPTIVSYCTIRPKAEEDVPAPLGEPEPEAEAEAAATPADGVPDPDPYAPAPDPEAGADEVEFAE